MRRAHLYLGLVVAAAFSASAQDASQPDQPPPDSAAADRAAGGGDVVHFKNGSKLTGQVLSRSPLSFELQIVPGVVLKVPRRQVEHVEYDDVTSAQLRRASTRKSGSAKQDLIPGSKLSSELYEKLSKGISDAPLKVEPQDLVIILNDLSKRTGVEIVVHESVKELPADKRTWGFDVPAGASLSSLLEDDLQRRLEAVDVVYKYDKVLVITKKAAKKLEDAQEQQGETPTTAEKPPEQ